METYHFHLNQRHFFFKNHLISTLKFKSKSREKQLLFIMLFALIMFFPEMNPCPSRTSFHRTLWSGSSSQHKASCFAWLIPSSEGSAAFSHTRNPADHFPWSSTEGWGVDLFSSWAELLPSSEVVSPFLKDAEYLLLTQDIWIPCVSNPSWGWWAVWKWILPVKKHWALSDNSDRTWY